MGVYGRDCGLSEKEIKSVFLWTDSAMAPGISQTAALSARRRSFPEYTGTPGDIFHRGMRSARKLLRGWMASIPSNGFLKALDKAREMGRCGFIRRTGLSVVDDQTKVAVVVKMGYHYSI